MYILAWVSKGINQPVSLLVVLDVPVCVAYRYVGPLYVAFLQITDVVDCGSDPSSGLRRPSNFFGNGEEPVFFLVYGIKIVSIVMQVSGTIAGKTSDLINEGETAHRYSTVRYGTVDIILAYPR
jgi:hypothetical protein